MAVFSQCGDGRYGGNKNRATMAEDYFASQASMAVAYQESTWRQFTCERDVLANGNATGLMQIITTWWPEGYNYELGRDITLGDVCTGTGYRGNETYNKDLGEAIWSNRAGRAQNEIGAYNPTTEHTVKETAAKYHGGPNAMYWNRESLNEVPPRWEPLSGGDVTYADAIWNHYENETWINALTCPCGD